MSYLIIGRPNVGKSSIFNILTGSKKNIIHKDEGTTRDWHKGTILLENNCFIYDTPGIVLNSFKKEDKKIKKIIESLIAKINYLLFVIDFKSTYNPIDQIILKWIRSFNKEIILIINKQDNKKTISSDFYKFGIKNIFFISCAHKLGFITLNKFLKEKINYQSKVINNYNKFNYSIAIYGKPNSGKSTFLNTLLGYERSLTSNQAGTTSDYVIEDFNYKSNNIRIFDTAGVGRQSKIKTKSINYLAIKESLKKIKTVNSTILLIDSFNGLDRQDKRIIKMLLNKAKTLIIVFNKIDLIKNKLHFKKNIKYELENNLYQIKNVNIFFISAYSKRQILKIFDSIIKNNIIKKYDLSTNIINKWMIRCTNMHTHPMIDKKKVNFKYAVKIKDHPITVRIFCNQAKKIQKSYIRYLKNDFNSYFKILNQDIKIKFSTSQNPYKKQY